VFQPPAIVACTVSHTLMLKCSLADQLRSIALRPGLDFMQYTELLNRLMF